MPEFQRDVSMLPIHRRNDPNHRPITQLGPRFSHRIVEYFLLLTDRVFLSMTQSIVSRRSSNEIIFAYYLAGKFVLSREIFYFGSMKENICITKGGLPIFGTIKKCVYLFELFTRALLKVALWMVV